MPLIRDSLLFCLPLTLLSTTTPVLAGQHDCSAIVVDKKLWNLQRLKGPKIIHDISVSPPSIENRTYTIDICAPIKEPKEIEAGYRFHTGTYVGMKLYDYNMVDKTERIDEVKNIAGQYHATQGRPLDPHYTRLKGLTDDEELEGLRIELNGGKVPFTSQGKPQKAIIDFICDRKVSGLEGFEDEAAGVLSSEEESATKSKREEEADDDEDDPIPDIPDMDKGKNLVFKSYGLSPDGDIDVLRLTWKTKYACEDAADNPPADDDTPGDGPKKSASWGFFTWFLIIFFLLAAAYIIFGSWLNYNRYGARGWDLLPHGDTIRDIPYIIKDWTQNAIDRVRGGPGGRGGYSAV